MASIIFVVVVVIQAHRLKPGELSVVRNNSEVQSIVVLFWFRPDVGITVVINLNVDCICSAADWTVLHIRLTCAFGEVQRNDDFLATGIADVASFFLRSGIFVTGEIR